MSHIEVNKTKLKNVNEDLLQQALLLVAKKHGGKVSQSIKDYYGGTIAKWEEQKIIGAISTPGVKRGLGLIIKEGQLQLVGDDFDCQVAFDELKKEIEGTYKKLAQVKALLSLGYKVNMETLPDGTLLIKGEKA